MTSGKSDLRNLDNLNNNGSMNFIKRKFCKIYTQLNILQYFTDFFQIGAEMFHKLGIYSPSNYSAI